MHVPSALNAFQHTFVLGAFNAARILRKIRPECPMPKRRQWICRKVSKALHDGTRARSGQRLLQTDTPGCPIGDFYRGLLLQCPRLAVSSAVGRWHFPRFCMLGGQDPVHRLREARLLVEASLPHLEVMEKAKVLPGIIKPQCGKSRAPEAPNSSSTGILVVCLRPSNSQRTFTCAGRGCGHHMPCA